MARYIVNITTDFALSAATEVTAFRIVAGAGNAVALRRLVLTDALAGSSDEGLRVRIFTGATGGTGTSQTPSPLARAAACDATAAISHTVEPTGGTTAAQFKMTPGSGIDMGWERNDFIRIPASGVLCVGVRTPAAQSRTSGAVAGYLIFEEL